MSDEDTSIRTVNPAGRASAAQPVVDHQPVHPSANRRESEAVAAAKVEVSSRGRAASAVAHYKDTVTQVEETENSRVARLSGEPVADVSIDERAAQGSYTVRVTDLAKAQVFQSQAIESERKIAATVISVRGADGEFRVPVEGDIKEAAAAVNEAEENFGVHASVVERDGNSRLVLSAEATGTAHGFKVTSSNASGNVHGHAILSFNQAEAPKDAVVHVNGREIRSEGNQVATGDGITLRLKQEGSARVTIEQDTQAVAAKYRQLKEAGAKLAEVTREVYDQLPTLLAKQLAEAVPPSAGYDAAPSEAPTPATGFAGSGQPPGGRRTTEMQGASLDRLLSELVGRRLGQSDGSQDRGLGLERRPEQAGGSERSANERISSDVPRPEPADPRHAELERILRQLN